MELIDLVYKIYNKELKENTLLKLTYNNCTTIEYWTYRDGRLYYTNEKNDYFRNEPMDLFSYLADRNILVEIIEEDKDIEEIVLEKSLNDEYIIDYNETGKHRIATNRKDRNIYIPRINKLIREVNKLKKEGK